MSAQKSKDEPQEHKSVTLISPSGHKYELGVSDSGNLFVAYKPEQEKSEA